MREGDSGGAVVDKNGRLVGVVFCILSHRKIMGCGRVNFCVGCEPIKGVWDAVERWKRSMCLDQLVLRNGMPSSPNCQCFGCSPQQDFLLLQQSEEEMSHCGLKGP